MKTPKAPDPMATAQAQAGLNRDTATSQQLTNMVNQITPDGTLKYNQTGWNSYKDSTGRTVKVPMFTATQSLSPGQQRLKRVADATEMNIAGIARDQSGRIGKLLRTPLDLSGAYSPDYQTVGSNDYSADRQRVEDALMTRMKPKLDQDKAALETRLANQGVRAGSAAYDAAMKNYSSATNDARMSAILGAGQEQSRLFDMELRGTGYNNELGMRRRQQDIQEMLTERNAPINEISALLSGSQVSQPNFVNTPNAQVAGVDYMGMINDQYKQKLTQNQAMMGGLFGLAAAPFAMFSDKRLKTNIKKVGKLDNGLPVYSYRYKAGGPQHIGVMAQDVEKKNPEAVVAHESGFKMVDYAQAVEG